MTTNAALAAVTELARRGRVVIDSNDRNLLTHSCTPDDVLWRGGVREDPDSGQLSFIEAPEVAGLPSTSASRLGQITGAAYIGYYDAATDGLPLVDVAIIPATFGGTVEGNYPEGSSTFLKFARTYWTMKATVQNAEKSDRRALCVHVLKRIDDLVWPLFFPFHGPLFTPADRRERDQRKFLEAFAPRIDIADFLRGNPILIRDRARQKLKGTDF